MIPDAITALHFDLLLDSTLIGEQSLEQTAGNVADFFFFFGNKAQRAMNLKAEWH